MGSRKPVKEWADRLSIRVGLTLGTSSGEEWVDIYWGGGGVQHKGVFPYNS